MTYLTIIDKLLILFNSLKQSIVVLLFIVELFILLFLKITKNISTKKLICITILSLLIAFLTELFLNYDILSKTFDNFMNIVFTNIYFPSIYIYLFIIISTYVITIISLLNNRLSNIYKVSNYIMSLILNIILILNLNLIAANKIDIFNNSSLYTNISIVSMLELSINIYILWLLYIVSIYIINTISTKIISIKNSKELINSNNIEIIPEPSIEYNPALLNVENPIEESYLSNTVKQELKVEETKALDETTFNKFIEINNTINKETYKNKYIILDDDIEEEPLDAEKSNDILNKIINNTLPLQHETKKELYSIEDYKVFSEMLKETIKINQNTALNINDILSLNLLNKFSYEDYSLFKKMLKNYTN